MLVLNNIEAVYGGVVLALSEVSLKIEYGQVMVLLGNNGSGKSTTLKSISGVLKTEEGKLTEGSIEFEGRRIDNQTPEKIARLGICHVLQERSAFLNLTVEENLQVGAYLRKDKPAIKRDMEKVYEYFPQLVNRRQQKSGYLSGGEQQMLVIGRALMARPKLIMLDEPSLGLASGLVIELFRILKQINLREKTTLLIAEQNAAVSLSIADHGLILQNGKVGFSGTAAELMDRSNIKEYYLGEKSEESENLLKKVFFR
ncbi:MAG: ABC transporter ATP-binding protein [Dehalococcoidales bacterium]|nr:ABC transporter ATP-binding protein [Dehalococcoidales bacterium]